jgi:hypothetical protein
MDKQKVLTWLNAHRDRLGLNFYHFYHGGAKA